MARAHSHAAPPSSISTPVDKEKLLELTRMEDRRMAWKLSREVFGCDSYGSQRLSAMLAVGLCPGRDGMARMTHRLRSVSHHPDPERIHFVYPKHSDHGNQGNEHAETNCTRVHRRTTFPMRWYDQEDNPPDSVVQSAIARMEVINPEMRRRERLPCLKD